MKKNIIVWAITIGEPIPTDYDLVRLHRTGILTRFLLEKNYKVVWWNSAFNHQQKTLRVKKTTFLKVSENETIVLLFGGGYKKNVSFKRLLDHKKIAKEFVKNVDSLDSPDIIISSFPPIELCEVAVKYASQRGIPILIDYRDLWPETFINILPSSLSKLQKIIYLIFNKKVKHILTSASGIIGITQPFLNIALDKIGRKRNSFDEVFNLAYHPQQISVNAVNEGFAFWTELGINSSYDGIRICFLGNINRKILQLKCVLEAAKKLEELDKKVQFIICGSGEALSYYKSISINLQSVIFPGLINYAQIKTLMQISHLGIVPYKPSIDFNNSLPNKVFEYFFGELPIITNLDGYLGQLLSTTESGIVYKTGDSRDLVEKICYLSENRESLQRMVINVRAIYAKQFSHDLIYRSYVKHIENICEMEN